MGEGSGVFDGLDVGIEVDVGGGGGSVFVGVREGVGDLQIYWVSVIVGVSVFVGDELGDGEGVLDGRGDFVGLSVKVGKVVMVENGVFVGLGVIVSVTTTPSVFVLVADGLIADAERPPDLLISDITTTARIITNIPPTPIGMYIWRLSSFKDFSFKGIIGRAAATPLPPVPIFFVTDRAWFGLTATRYITACVLLIYSVMVLSGLSVIL